MTIAGERIDWIQRRIVNPQSKSLLILEPFQTEFIEGLYQDHIIEAGFSLPRKNGKTGLLAGLALAELDLNEDADVVLGATKLKQASRQSGVFGVMKRYVAMNKGYFEDKFYVSRNNSNPVIEHKQRGTKAEAIAVDDTDSAQGLNPSLAIMDEFGTSFWTPERWAAISMATGAKPGAKVVGISTPDSLRSSMYAMRLAYQQGQTDGSLYWQEHSADVELDWRDPKTWVLANPALGKFLDEDSLRKDLRLGEALFRKFRLGQWVDLNILESWLGVEGPKLWDDCAHDEVALASDLPTYLGVDKSWKDDCTAIVAIQKQGEAWVSKAFIFWPSPTIDHAKVRQEIRRLCREYKVVAVGYDRTCFVEGAQELIRDRLPMVEVPQNLGGLGPGYKAFYKALLEKNFLHERHEDYRSQVLSAIVYNRDSRGNFTLGRPEDGPKVDSCVATGIALSVALKSAAPVVQWRKKIY